MKPDTDAKRTPQTPQVTYEQLRDDATAAYEKARVAARDWERDLRAAIRQRPIRSVILAAGIGFMVGKIVGRFSR